MPSDDANSKSPYKVHYAVLDMSGVLYALQQLYNEGWVVEREKAVAAAAEALNNQPDILDTASEKQLQSSHNEMLNTLIRVMSK